MSKWLWGHADRAEVVIQCEDKVQEQGEQDGDRTRATDSGK
jgi:hypothetical protein